MAEKYLVVAFNSCIEIIQKTIFNMLKMVPHYLVQVQHAGRITAQCELQKFWDGVVAKATLNIGRAGYLAKTFTCHIEMNFKEQHSPVFYAAKLNITKSYLRKICKKTIGLAPSNCIYARLMLEACKLLEEHDKTIKEVAFCLGFKTASHFSRFFKAQSGLSPTRYRILHLKAP